MIESLGIQLNNRAKEQAWAGQRELQHGTVKMTCCYTRHASHQPSLEQQVTIILTPFGHEPENVIGKMLFIDSEGVRNVKPKPSMVLPLPGKGL